MNHSNFSTFPYLFVNAIRGSGKTRLLKIIASLSHEGQLTASLTEAVMFRTTGTLALDEFEGLNSKDNASLRELLNASYKKGTKIMRMTKKRGPDGESLQVEEFEPYRPLVMANIFGMTEVLGDRCVTILLEKSSALHIIKLVEDNHKNLFYNIFLEFVIHYEGSGASEYEIYFNYMLKNHSDKIKIRNLNWKKTNKYTRDTKQ